MTSVMKRQNGSGNPFQQHRLLSQIKDKPISFVRAKNPEPVAIKPASYVLIKPRRVEEDEEDESAESAEKTGNADSSATTFIPLTASSDPGTRTPSKINKAWKKGTPNPGGLINQGVTCYMNSAVQLLMHMPAMSNYLAEVLLTKKLPGTVSQVFAQLYGKLFGGKNGGKNGGSGGSGKSVFPRQLISRLDDINCMMSEWNQEDAHEYFMSLMSRLQEDSTAKGAKLNSSVIYDMFGGNLEQIVVCGGCGNESVTQQDFYDLSVNLDEKKQPETRISLKRCITSFFEEEQIQKKDGYKCDECKKTTAAKKRSRVNEFPEHLVVHVKRFKFVNDQPKKMGAPLDYPAELDLGHYSRDQPRHVPYKLIGVIAHCGRTTGSGHYIAHVRQPNGKWATYDDDLIEPLSEKKALKEEDAYMLMYQKLTPAVKAAAKAAKSANPAAKSAKPTGGRVTKPVAKSGKGQRKMADIDNIFASAKRKRGLI